MNLPALKRHPEIGMTCGMTCAFKAAHFPVSLEIEIGVGLA